MTTGNENNNILFFEYFSSETYGSIVAPESTYHYYFSPTGESNIFSILSASGSPKIMFSNNFNNFKDTTGFFGTSNAIYTKSNGILPTPTFTPSPTSTHSPNITIDLLNNQYVWANGNAPGVTTRQIYTYTKKRNFFLEDGRRCIFFF